MDVDFSQEARKFLEAHPQSEDQPLSLEDRISDYLEVKANLHNDNFNDKVTVDQLKSVFNRGQSVTDSVYCVGKSTMQWAFARVNNFLYMHEGKKVSKAYRIADRDIADGDLEYDVETSDKVFFDYQELDFAVARLDIKKAGVSEKESNSYIKGLQGLTLSEELNNFVESESAKRAGRKSAAQTPAKPSERKKGSKKNPKGSAGQGGKKITFSEKVTTSLKNKVKEHNEKHSKKVTLSQLKKVYRRGAGAFSSSHRPNQTRGSWAMARVNMFLKMMRGGKVKKSYREADQDVAKGHEEYYIEQEGQSFVDFEDIDFVAAAEDLEKVAAYDESWQEIEDLDYTEAEKKTLNKPFRLPSGSKKKFGVYVKNPKTGNTVMVKFGDPNMEIKRDDPNARKNFRARHKCDTAKDKTSARYWSCKMWSKKSVSEITASDSDMIEDVDIDDLPAQEDILILNPELVQVTDQVEEDNI